MQYGEQRYRNLTDAEWETLVGRLPDSTLEDAYLDLKGNILVVSLETEAGARRLPASILEK